MKIASEKQEYEKAAYIRDKKIAIEQISQKQIVSNINENDIDVIGIAKNELYVCIEVFFIRKSKMIGRESYFFDDLKDMENSDIISGFLKQYYMDSQNVPSKIMIKYNIEDKDAIEQWLSKKENKKIEIKVPKIGEKLRFIEMADNNAKVTLENKLDNKFDILTELKTILGLEKLPRKIETYDISNISGEFIVAGMCVMQDGKINKKLSRRFRIKSVLGQDDPKCTEEVVTRRLKYSIDTDKSGFGALPDVIFADGGITQINAIKNAIKKYNLEIPVFGMVKDDKHTTRALIDENRKEIKMSERLMHTITNFQDTVHNTAIEYHRKLRDAEVTKSALDKINGIGNVKKQELLRKFGSVEKIKNATIEEICEIKGINKNLAEEILKNID